MTGLGNIHFFEPTRKYLFPVSPMRFVITSSSDSVESLRFEGGILVTAGRLQKGASYQLEIEIQATSWLAMQFAFTEYEQIVNPQDISLIKYGKVPSTAPYEVAAPDISTALVAVTVTEDVGSGATLIKQGQRNIATTPATPGVGEVGVDIAAKKLIFNAKDAGAPFGYRYLKNYTGIRSLGAGPNPVRPTSFSFSGIGYLGDDRVMIRIPTISASSLPDFGFTGDVGSWVCQYGIIPPAGQTLPFEAYMMRDIEATP